MSFIIKGGDILSKISHEVYVILHDRSKHIVTTKPNTRIYLSTSQICRIEIETFHDGFEEVLPGGSFFSNLGIPAVKEGGWRRTKSVAYEMDRKLMGLEVRKQKV